MDFSFIGRDIASNLQKPNPIETEKLKQLRDININLKKEIDFAIQQAEDAKKDAKFSKTVSLISLVVAFISAAAAILPHLF